jgi:hypothetical protein
MIRQIKFNLHENENGIDFSIHIKPISYKDGIEILAAIRKLIAEIKGD